MFGKEKGKTVDASLPVQDKKVEEAVALLKQEQQRKMVACINEINAVLEKYGMTIKPSIVPKQNSLV